MLFVVYGATLDLGYESRRIFKELGFDVIQKYNYVSDDAPVDKSKYVSFANDENYSKWYDDKIYIEKEQLSLFDFSYNLDGVFVGFNQQQIMDSVRGVKNAVLTVGGSTIDLLVQLKKAYGDYLTIINLYEDKETALKSANESAGVSSKEVETRINANTRMQQLYIDNKEIFDEIVIYNGEDSIYNLEALERQFKQIINSRSEIEKSLNNKKYVSLPYSGAEPYVFVSYSHDDKDKMFPILAMLQRASVRVWYDDGIVGGTNWRRIIAEKIQSSSGVLLFSSSNSVQSENVEAEINGAFLCKKQIYTIRLDESTFDLAYEMYLSKDHMLYITLPDFESKLLNSLPAEVIKN